MLKNTLIFNIGKMYLRFKIQSKKSVSHPWLQATREATTVTSFLFVKEIHLFT